VQLIESLEESKRVATEINEKVTEARETETAINDSRNKYRPVAKRGAMLFFLLNSLNKIHAFYQYSLNAFVVVFSRGLERATGGRKKKDKTTLAELARRVTGEAAPFEQVMEMARRSSNASAAGSKAGSKRGSRATDTGPAKGESVVAGVYAAAGDRVSHMLLAEHLCRCAGASVTTLHPLSVCVASANSIRATPSTSSDPSRQEQRSSHCASCCEVGGGMHTLVAMSTTGV
jgi:hypothetical protein